MFYNQSFKLDAHCPLEQLKYKAELYSAIFTQEMTSLLIQVIFEF